MNRNDINYDFTSLSCILLLLFLLRHWLFFLRIINTVFKNKKKYMRHLGKDWERCVIVQRSSIIDILAISVFVGVIVAASCRGNHSRRVGGATVLHIYHKGVATSIRNNLRTRNDRTNWIWGPKKPRGVALITAKDIEPLIAERALERGRARVIDLRFWRRVLFVRSFVRAFRPASFMSPQVGAHISGGRNVLSSSD